MIVVERNYTVGEIVKTKKPHVCGSKDWMILRVGADIKLECCGCKREIIMMRFELNKRIIK